MPNALRKADPQELAKLGIDPKFLAEVQAHCQMVGNEVVIDRSWWLATVAAAAAKGAGDAAQGPAKSWRSIGISVIDIPGNLLRSGHGSEHRRRVVARMDKLDTDVEDLRGMVRSGQADEEDVPVVIAQLIESYRSDIMALWDAYWKRYNRPYGDHPDWPC
jgi:hypothetical protein